MLFAGYCLQLLAVACRWLLLVVVGRSSLLSLIDGSHWWESVAAFNCCWWLSVVAGCCWLLLVAVGSC